MKRLILLILILSTASSKLITSEADSNEDEWILRIEDENENPGVPGDIKALYTKEEGDILVIRIDFYNLNDDVWGFIGIDVDSNPETGQQYYPKGTECTLTYTLYEGALMNKSEQSRTNIIVESFKQNQIIIYLPLKLLGSPSNIRLTVYSTFDIAEKVDDHQISYTLDHNKTIVIDGYDNDWNNIPPVYTHENENDFDFITPSKLYITNDDEYIYFKINFIEEPRMNILYRLIGIGFDTDLNQASGGTGTCFWKGGFSADCYFWSNLRFGTLNPIGEGNSSQVELVLWNEQTSQWNYPEDLEISGSIAEVIEYEMPIKYLNLGSSNEIHIVYYGFLCVFKDFVPERGSIEINIKQSTVEDSIFTLNGLVLYSQLLGTNVNQDILIYQDDLSHNITHYFDKMSYGNINITLSGHATWVASQNDASYYGSNNNFKVHELIQEIVMDTDDVVDYDKYNFLVIVHSGDNEAKSCDLDDIWTSHLVNLDITTNDATMVRRAIIISINDGWGVLAHEIGHFLNLIDLYDVYGVESFVGEWSLMASGYQPVGLESYSLIKLGWIDTDEIYSISMMPFQDINVTLNPLDEILQGFKVIKIYLIYKNYYLIEYRHNSSYDANLPDHGILITQIDEGIRNGRVKVMNQDPRSKSLYNATFDIRDNKTSTYYDEQYGFQVNLLSKENNKYEINIKTGLNINTYNYEISSNYDTFNIIVDTNSYISNITYQSNYLQFNIDQHNKSYYFVTLPKSMFLGDFRYVLVELSEIDVDYTEGYLDVYQNSTHWFLYCRYDMKGPSYLVKIRAPIDIHARKPEPEPPLRPAEFEVSNLIISPAEEVEEGEDIIFSVKVTNIGETEGSYTVEFKVDGETVETEIVTLARGDSTTVSFEETWGVGSYTVEVDRLTGSFTVNPKPSFWDKIPGSPYESIIIGLIVVIIIFWYARARKL